MPQSLSIITVTRNRAGLLKEKALSSLLKQTSRDFEWIVINDGGDTNTNEVILNLNTQFRIVYREMKHPTQGFGLCWGRNLGLLLATSSLVTYLDDDNSFKPSFVEETLKFFASYPSIKLSMPRQERIREVWQQGKKVKTSKKFISPETGTELEELVTHQQLFDSNGFTHYLQQAPVWNPNYRIYCDYEYFLQCLSNWGQFAFRLNPRVLVEYIQTNQGVIGQSNLKDWALELLEIFKSKRDYSILRNNPDWVTQIARLHQRYHQKSQLPAAFEVND